MKEDKHFYPEGYLEREKSHYEIKYLDQDGKELFEKGVINEEQPEGILKLYASEFPDPKVVYLNGKLINPK
jgi:hypothetical protein